VNYLSRRYAEIGLMPFQHKYQHPFSKATLLDDKQGINLVGLLQGDVEAHQYVIVTAHYDHLGRHKGKTLLGADDNASGVAGLLALAQFLSQHKRHFSYVFVATDLEENGLYGSFDFVNNPPVPLAQIRLNINLDMLSQGGNKHRLYLSGSRQVPQVNPIFLTARARLNSDTFNLKLGHDNRKFRTHSSAKNVDWKKASDHYAFAKKRIPYLYFGVDTHKDYHQSSDTFENADKVFFKQAVASVIFITQQLDQDPRFTTQTFEAP
jgi:Zn-dependent M28 family amino/carboxypeptidase